MKTRLFGPGSFLATVCFFALCRSPVFAGPQIDVVVGPDAPRLETLAARELAGQFKRLFDADMRIHDGLPAASQRLILVGSPATNPAVASWMKESWPKLSEQGLLLQSREHNGKQALIVGGGSPVATLWAVYELGHHFGVRYFLSGDAFPARRPDLELDGIAVRMEPTLRTRSWQTIDNSAVGPESWGLAEHRRVLAQLAKLKFNRILLSVYPWQPFVHYEFRGVAKQTAKLWSGFQYPVAGDTAGRRVFDGADVFANPDFAGKNSYADRTAAGIALARGIIAEAQRLGMSAAVSISPLEFPVEFANVLTGARQTPSRHGLIVGPTAGQPPDSAMLRELASTKIAAYLRTYPAIDSLYLRLPEAADWAEQSPAAWKRLNKSHRLSDATSLSALMASARDRKLIPSGQQGVVTVQTNICALDFFNRLLGDDELFRRASSKLVSPVVTGVDPALFGVLDRLLPPRTAALHLIGSSAGQVVNNRSLLGDVPAKKVPSSLVLMLADDNVGVLPQLSTGAMHTVLGELRQSGWDGFTTRNWMIGDLDPAVHYLSRAGFDAKITPEQAYRDLFVPVCGRKDVVDRLVLGFHYIEQATQVIDANAQRFARPAPGMLFKHRKSEAAPEWWNQALEHYTSAMIEMFRAHGNTAPQSRKYLYYYAKKGEFSVEYLNCLLALRQSEVAKAKGDMDEAVEKLEAAVESMYNAINSASEIARDNSDRGMIAVLNAYAYRPLKTEFERLLEETEDQ